MTVSLDTQKALKARMQDLGIREEDLDESFIRSQGAGGQKVNKSSSCVRLVHRPTGLEVKCQISRSQTDNRFFARRILCEKYAAQVLKQKTEKDREVYRIRKQKRRRSRRAKEKMLANKKVHSVKKELRQKISFKEE